MKFLKCTVLPALLAEGTVFLFFLVAALFMRRSDDPETAVRIVPVLATVLSAALCGGIAALLTEGQRFENPLLAGGFMALLHLAISLLPGGEEKSVLLPISLMILQIVLAFAAGMLIFKKVKSGGRKMRKKAKKRYRGRA